MSDMPSDGTCVRCGCAPRNAQGLCAACQDEDMCTAPPPPLMQGEEFPAELIEAVPRRGV